MKGLNAKRDTSLTNSFDSLIKVSKLCVAYNNTKKLNIMFLGRVKTRLWTIYKDHNFAAYTDFQPHLLTHLREG